MCTYVCVVCVVLSLRGCVLSPFLLITRVVYVWGSLSTFSNSSYFMSERVNIFSGEFFLL